jgi:uncharacterized membrane protein YjgN (DUF898 family)
MCLFMSLRAKTYTTWCFVAVILFSTFVLLYIELVLPEVTNTTDSLWVLQSNLGYLQVVIGCVVGLLALYIAIKQVNIAQSQSRITILMYRLNELDESIKYHELNINKYKWTVIVSKFELCLQQKLDEYDNVYELLKKEMWLYK